MARYYRYNDGVNRALITYKSPTAKTPSEFIRFSLWLFISRVFFERSFFPSYMRPHILRFFGARVGRKVLIGRHVSIHFPWKLEIGDCTWIGVGVSLNNTEKVLIGSDVCISQRAFITSGSHDFKSKSFKSIRNPIEISNGAWICVDGKVLPGVRIGECSVVSAGEIARKSLPDYSMLVGGQVRPIDPPK
jgi:putative colanic acid biosynthesis acetyltransferase WcaF